MYIEYKFSSNISNKIKCCKIQISSTIGVNHEQRSFILYVDRISDHRMHYVMLTNHCLVVKSDYQD